MSTPATTPTPNPQAAGPSSGHLGTSWEIAVAVIIIVLACIIIGTVTWQIRRKRQRQRQALSASSAEDGRVPTLSQMEYLPSDGIKMAAEVGPDRATDPLTKPRPTASPYRPRKSSTSSSDTGHRPVQPQRYYWSP